METLLTTEEVAKTLRQSITTIQRWSKIGFLPVAKVGRKLLFDENEIRNWLKTKRITTSPHQELDNISRWSRDYAKKCGLDKMSEGEVEEIIHQNRKKHA